MLRYCTWSCTCTHTSCYATARCSCTCTHTSCNVGVGWGGVGGLITFKYTSTHTSSCYATARCSCTCTHMSCYATARCSCTCTHTSCYATACCSCTCTHTSCNVGVGWGGGVDNAQLYIKSPNGQRNAKSKAKPNWLAHKSLIGLGCG